MNIENLEIAGSFVDEYLMKALPDHRLDISLNTKDDYEKFNVYLTYWAPRFRAISALSDGAIGRTALLPRTGR